MEQTVKLSAFEEKAQQLEVIRQSIKVNAVFDTPYIVMNVLATVVACYGLLANSPAVVIGAMIIAMLLGPITGVALGLVEGDNSLLKSGTRAWRRCAFGDDDGFYSDEFTLRCRSPARSWHAPRRICSIL